MQPAKIVKIKKIGIKRTKDIEVNNSSHTFYGNEILTSNSHGVGYGSMSYYTAYAKAHFPLHFFVAYLSTAKDKADSNDEVRTLVNDAKAHGYEVFGPSVDMLFEGTEGQFNLSSKGIHFGLENVKKIGRNHVIKFLNGVKEVEKQIGKPITEWSWLEFLVMFSDKTSTTVVNNLIYVGTFGAFKQSRSKMAFEYNIWQQITKREKAWFTENYQDYKSIQTMLKAYLKVERKEGGPSTSKRATMIESLYQSVLNPSMEVKTDNPAWVAKTETELLSVPVTCSLLDSCNTANADTTCKEFINGKIGNMTVAVEISSVRPYTIKKGQNKGQKMGFITGTDQTGTLSSIMCFSDKWEEFESDLYVGNTLLITGERNKDSLIINRVMPI